jgi:hypothetical protein
MLHRIHFSRRAMKNELKIAPSAMEVAGRLPIGFAHNHKKLDSGEA